MQQRIKSPEFIIEFRAISHKCNSHFYDINNNLNTDLAHS
jgi:hypothetical protein